MNFCKKIFILTLFLLPFQVYAKEKVPSEWIAFLNDLKAQMLERGIDQKTLDQAYGKNLYYHPKPEVVAHDQKQAEFILTSEAYLKRIVTEKRVQNVRKHYAEMKKKYADIEEKYDVPMNYLSAFWAVETNFGQNKGRFHLIDTLTNLSYKNRRSAFFKNELYYVLKIMQDEGLKNDKLLGSWAGAMGHFQFMPSTYAAYAVDWDGDGVADIWDNIPDAVASAAHYLHKIGFKGNEPWGMEVLLPWNFDYNLVGRDKTFPIRKWKKYGLLDAEGKPLSLDNDLKASLILPDGHRGKSYLVFHNFKRIMIWNRSENYALAIGVLSDYALSDKPFQSQKSLKQPITDDDVRDVQRFANKILKTKLKVDGRLGSQTKKAVKQLQKKAGLVMDGYPDERLLKKIRNYNPKIGFHVPVPPRKVRK